MNEDDAMLEQIAFEDAADDEMIRKLTAAIQKLPVLPNRLVVIDDAANALLTDSFWGSVADLRTARGDNRAIDELGKLAQLLKETSSLLGNMSKEAHIALNNEQPSRSGSGFANERVFLKLDAYVHQALNAKANLEAKPVKAKAGAPKKILASEIACTSLGYFEALTGRRATINVHPVTKASSGKFLDFLTEVFQILGVKASAVAQARAAIKNPRSVEAWGARRYVVELLKEKR